jgi:hypothetical protein
MLSRYMCSAHIPLAAAAKLCCLKDQCPARVSLQPLRDDVCQTCQTVCDNLMATTPESQQGAHSSTVEENKEQALPQAVLSRFVAICAGLSCPTNNSRHWQHLMIHQRHPQGHPYPWHGLEKNTHSPALLGSTWCMAQNPVMPTQVEKVCTAASGR